MKSAREAMIRGGAASVERALMDAAPAIAEALRDPRWLPPPPLLSLEAVDDGNDHRGTYAPRADEAEAYRALEAPVRRLRLAREACTAIGIGRARRGGEEESDNTATTAATDAADDQGVPLPLALRVYEASADAAAAMRTADGELLKALAGLCGSIYPALRRQQEREDAASLAAPADPPLLAREAEMRAALILFYACMPARPLPQNLAQCLGAEGLEPYWKQEDEGQNKTTTLRPRDRRLVLTALRGASAALSGDWISFGSCYAAMPRVPRHVMARCLPRVRAQAVRCMARCFAPSLPVAAAERWLGLRVVTGDGDSDAKHAPLVALLEDAAGSGCKGSAAALAARERARRARADAVWGEEGGGGGGGGDSWEDRADEQDVDGDFFTDVVFKPPPTSTTTIAAKKPQ